MKRLLVIAILTLALVGCSWVNANNGGTDKPTKAEEGTKPATSIPVSREGMVLIPNATFEFRNGEQKQMAQVESFYIDQYEVKVEDFNKFLTSSNYRTSAAKEGEEEMFKKVNSLGANYPVGFVSVADAKAYCSSLGKRIPSPQEWQLAALGVDGRKWPWGSWSDKTANVNTSAVAQTGSFPKDKSPYGVFDMGGNMLEWTTQGSIGGSYVTDSHNPTTLLTNLDDWVANTGFRCAADTK